MLYLLRWLHFFKITIYIEWNVIQQEKEQNSDTYNNVDEP